MKKIIVPLFVIAAVFSSCESASPEKSFGIAALNCNTLYGFAGDGMQRELASPSVKLVDEKSGTTAPMKRSEVVETKLQMLQENYQKIKDLGVNDDNKEMITAAIAVYDYVLPVYKNEYKELADLYDNGAANDKIEAKQKAITEKYENRFYELYNNVLTTGKAFASRHGIKVREVNPSPSFK